MTVEREEQILRAGFQAAKDQMIQHSQRKDYPRDFTKLYDWLEEKYFNLFEAVELKQYQHVKTMAAEIIITASEIAEYAQSEMDYKRILQGGKNEMANNKH